jgi:HAD superfamily hydrolase (TIGR01450 family)
VKLNTKQIDAAINAVAIDLDGVVYIGNEVVPGAAEAIEALRNMVKWVYFTTNNSGKRRQTIREKLCAMGIPSDETKIITSAYATAVFLKSLAMSSSESSSTAFVIGSDELKNELRESGISVVEDYNKNKIDFLVVGFDQDFSYKKTCASLDVLSSGAKFVACNRDRTYPVEGGRVMPACGPIVAAIECAFGKKPDYEVGKPNTFFLEMIIREAKVKPDQILVVGDTIESDIAMAMAFGSPSVLISENLEDANTGVTPSLRICSLRHLPLALSEL